jgi:AcrR family transcriptional regulator
MEQEKLNIVQKVYALYSKYGIKSITLDDIAREMGLSKKTLYQHFTDKNELVSAVFLYEKEHRMSCMGDIFSKKMNAIEETFAINRYVAEMMKDFNPAMEYDLKKYYPEIYEKRRDAIIMNMYQRQLDNLKRGMKEGLYRNDITPEYIARLFILRMVNVHEVPCFDKSDFFSPDFFREIFVYHIRGLASDKGLKVLEKEIKKWEKG